MKVYLITAAVVALGMACAGAASAQMIYSQMPANAGNAPMSQDNTFADMNKQVSAGAGAETRLHGTRQENVEDALYKDRAAIKALKKQLKEATTDEDRQSIKDNIKALESDIVAIQQG